MVNLRARVHDRLKPGFDIIIGIPSYNNERFVGHVVKTAAVGLKQYLKDWKSLILVCDGGSLDDTREVAESVEIPSGIERIVTTYRGIPGKGSAVMAMIEAADLAGAELLLLFDADLRSITPEWIDRMSRPVLEMGFDYLTPYYLRHKHDGTITNNIVYPILKGVFGVEIRQPIGGDFAIGKRLIKRLINREHFNHLTARFGIDVWMTTQAFTSGRVGQVGLGTKVHAPKEPKNDLTPMFVQVVYTLFRMLIIYEEIWREGKQIRVELVSDEFSDSIEEIPIEPRDLITEISYAVRNFGPLYERIMSRSTVRELISSLDRIPIDLWVQIVYDFAVTFRRWERNRRKLLRLLLPLYLGRVGSFALETKDMDSSQAEVVVRKNAECFWKMRDYFINRWDESDQK